MSPIVIVGASLAGLSAAEALRGAGYEGGIEVLEAATELPADRPPLSKQVLAGAWEPERAAQPSAARIDELDLRLRLGTPALGLDVARREVLTPHGPVAASGIVIATGAAPRRLPGDTPEGVFELRTLSDCLALRDALDAGPARVAVIGAGFVGAEVAATCRGRGHEVVLIDPLPTPMGRVFGDEVGGVFASLHAEAGVQLRLGVGVSGLLADGGGRVSGVALTDGSSEAASVVVVGIGVAPSTGWLEGSGLTLDDGVLCDGTLLAAPGVVAAGDVCRWPNALFDETMRVEHWDHAIEQGMAAGRRLLDDSAPPFTPVPWFWSDQYDRKIQFAGRAVGADEARLVDGSLEERRFVVLYRRSDRVVGVLGVNRPRHVMTVRANIAARMAWADAVGGFE